ncbi:MAG: helix-turn-helix domain-containing protein [Alphaproteobacteria bacterium]|nr:helix-turn-helix domain-containing protein [Alphaproteobacteria bacterium]
MITSLQALLARTMTGLSQQEVSGLLGWAHQTLSKIENGDVNPPASRLKALQDFYESRGVEFLEGEGVRKRQIYVNQYSGAEGFRAFMDDVYETAKEYGGDICLFNSKPSMWHEWLGKEWYEMHAKRMKRLGTKIKVKITVQEGEDFFILDSAEHRWFSKDMWKEKIFYAYGPKLGFLDFSDNNVHIMVLSQREFADSFRVLFDVAWEHVAKIPSLKGQ